MKTPSSVEGTAGPWPDALVPDVDAFVGEKRRAFPFDVPAGEARAIWVELFVPPTATAGALSRAGARHAPTAHAPRDGARRAHRARVHAAAHVVAAGDLRLRGARRRQGAPRPVAARRRRSSSSATKWRRCAIASALHGGTMEPAPWRRPRRQAAASTWRAYDAEVGPFLDGKVDRGGPAEGARWTRVRLARAATSSRAPTRDEYARQMVAHLRARGWLDRVFDYTFDEPPDDKLDDVRARAPPRARAAAPGVPRLVTHALDDELRGAVDIWCPVVNFVDDKAGQLELAAARRLRRAGRGERIWWYQALYEPRLRHRRRRVLHRLAELRRRRAGDEPSHLRVADVPLSHGRRALLRHRRGVRARARIRGSDQLLFGGNGDGTLFYPGRAARDRRHDATFPSRACAWR